MSLDLSEVERLRLENFALKRLLLRREAESIAREDRDIEAKASAEHERIFASRNLKSDDWTIDLQNGKLVKAEKGTRQ